jgi:Protein of unknown function (DUF2891)
MIARNLAACIALAGVSAMADNLTTEAAGRFAKLALACVHREYPNKIAHVLKSIADIKAPRDLTPAFYGCFDWHSSVHGHWLLARLARTFPDAAFTPQAKAALAQSLTAANLKRESEYVKVQGRESFERPYGLAWLLQLAAELHQWAAPEARDWATAMQPLESAAVRRISDWLKKLSHPVRSGEHSNTAFALGLMLDYARSLGDRDFGQLLEAKVREFYMADRDCPVTYEPSGEDFLSPCLAGGGRRPQGRSRQRVRGLAWTFPAIERRLVRTRGCDGPERWEARPSGRLEPQPRVDAGRDRIRASKRRFTHNATSNVGEAARGRRFAGGYR